MRKSLLFVFGLLALSATQISAKDIPVKFTKGSYCNSYSGVVSNLDAFSLYLTKGQTLTVNVNDGEINKVLNPRNAKVSPLEEGVTGASYKVSQSGKYRIFVSPDLKVADVEFCAY